MKIMQPFDFRERVYGAAVWASRESHCNILSQSRTIPERIKGTTYSGPRDFADIEELIITSDDNAVAFPSTRGSSALFCLCCE